MTRRPIAAALAAKRRSPEAVLDLLGSRDDPIVGLGNGEPVAVLEAIEAGAASPGGPAAPPDASPPRPRLHRRGDPQPQACLVVSLAPDKEAFHRGACELVPNNFSEVPSLMRRSLRSPVVLAAVSAPDAHGFFSRGSHADYVASFIGEAPFFLEVCTRMPRTFGENQLHSRSESPTGRRSRRGIGTIPKLVLGLLGDHRDLGVHTELLGDGFVPLVEGGAVTGTRKSTHGNKLITTTALGGRRCTTSSPRTRAFSPGPSTTRTTLRTSPASRA